MRMLGNFVLVIRGTSACKCAPLNPISLPVTTGLDRLWEYCRRLIENVFHWWLQDVVAIASDLRHAVGPTTCLFEKIVVENEAFAVGMSLEQEMSFSIASVGLAVMAYKVVVSPFPHASRLNSATPPPLSVSGRARLLSCHRNRQGWVSNSRRSSCAMLASPANRVSFVLKPHGRVLRRKC